ncbi:hypothetical protein AALB16_08810 [Lachnospiraceae bacterium 62-35]
MVFWDVVVGPEDMIGSMLPSMKTLLIWFLVAWIFAVTAVTVFIIIRRKRKNGDNNKRR